MLLHPDRYWWLVPASFVLAFLWQFWPLPPTARQIAPDAIIAVTLYWSMQRPPRMSSTWALVMGVLRDGIAGSPLGMQALALVCVAYITQRFGERLRSFALWQQTLAAGVLCALYQIISNSIWMLFNHNTNITLLSLAPVIATSVCWPACFLSLKLLEHGYLHAPRRS